MVLAFYEDRHWRDCTIEVLYGYEALQVCTEFTTISIRSLLCSREVQVRRFSFHVATVSSLKLWLSLESTCSSFRQSHQSSADSPVHALVSSSFLSSPLSPITTASTLKAYFLSCFSMCFSSFFFNFSVCPVWWTNLAARQLFTAR